MNIFRSLITLAVFLAVLSAVQAFAEEGCAGVAPETEVWVAEKLDEAKAARDQGDFVRSSELLHEAATGFPRMADVSIASRCMGQGNWRRYNREKQQTYLQLGQAAEMSAENNSALEGFSFYVEGGNRDDVDRLLSEIPDDANRYASAGRTLRGKMLEYQWATDNGFTLLEEEQADQVFFQARLDRLIAQSKLQGNALLRSETEIIEYEISEEEEMAMSAEKNVTAIIGSMVGDQSVLTANEARWDFERARRSLNRLREARLWLEWVGEAEAAPVYLRAEQRGDALLGWGSDTTIGLEGRDAYYEAAIRYFEFADAEAKLTSAKAARKAIEPALNEARATREAKFEEKAGQMQESLKNYQQSIEKSETEKEIFNEEADSLEAELDF